MMEDNWIYTGIHAGDPVPHGVEAALGRVDLDDLFQLPFASGQLLLPECAHGGTILNESVLWVFPLV